MQDAVAACIFTGVAGNDIAGKIPALVTDPNAYNQHKKFLIPSSKKASL